MKVTYYHAEYIYNIKSIKSFEITVVIRNTSNII